jgi:hypothetical protein
MQVLAEVHRLVQLQTELQMISSRVRYEIDMRIASGFEWERIRGLTVPPSATSSTPSDTGNTANLGRGKFMSTAVDKERETESR